MNKKISHLLLVTTALLWSSLAQAQTATIQSKQYEDGGYYEGTFKNGRQHGQGTYSLPSGYTYTGNWENGEISGQGEATFPDGSVYTGAFSNGKPHGERPHKLCRWWHL